MSVLKENGEAIPFSVVAPSIEEHPGPPIKI